MQCQNCEKPLHPSDERCPACGARPLHRRVILGRAPEEFNLTAEEPFELGDRSQKEDWEIALDYPKEHSSAAAQAPVNAPAAVPWGGFLRRSIALLIDLIFLSVLSATMAYLSYIAYKVGLAAHGRAVMWDNVTPLFVWLSWAWLGLATLYFVLFHGMGGRTIGKWFMGLRVVGAGQTEISCRQAMLRWVATVGFAPVGLGFFWALWSREKRAWHDLLARTWVVRE